MNTPKNEITTDALGNEIVIGNLYGYSRSDGGFSHTVIGMASTVKNGKVRLVNCVVKRFLYGKESDFNSNETPPDVSIRTYMVFPVEKKN